MFGTSLSSSSHSKANWSRLVATLLPKSLVRKSLARGHVASDVAMLSNLMVEVMMDWLATYVKLS
jgi:hypothetical protein